MLKINLSDKEEVSPAADEEAADQTLSGETQEQPLEGVEKVVRKTKKTINHTRPLVMLLLLALVALVYFRKDEFLSLLGGKQEEIVQVEAPPPPPPPEPEVVAEEPDPTFVVLNGLSETVPVKVWLSSAVIMFDGSYEIKGIAFSHAAINTMITSLEPKGNINSKLIPKKAGTPEAVYNFAVSGKLNEINVPEILDIIPTNNLVALADGIKGRSEEFGVRFTRLPESGKTYSEKDIPFSLEGSYEGLKKVIAELCPEGDNVKVYRLIISPSSPGRAFDYIKASFSLRTVSSI
ncbi:MAG: PilN domain-containing protein [Candidatus Latescibacteria bacterium]|jgi:hypothetical protein|nr:PilN domain-containing protein [Candidatus Latescibacterota bacterium]